MTFAILSLSGTIPYVMYADQNRLYSHTELYDIYAVESSHIYGGELSQKQMRVKLTDYLADDIIVIRCDGCASHIGFKGFVGSMMKLVKVNGDDEESEIDAIIRMIRKEAREVTKSSLALWRKCGGVGRVAESAACIVSCY